MRSIRGKDTAPERALRTALHREGIRYRKHSAKVAGRPDVSITKYRVAIFIDGCFWHGCPEHYRAPRTNAGFWASKVKRNRARRTQVLQELAEGGWACLEVWECKVGSEHQRVLEFVKHRLR